MGRPADRLDLDPEIAPVRQADVEPGRFGDDRAIHLDPADEVCRPDAAILLVRHGGHDHIAGERRLRINQRLERRHAGRQAAFHVERAAAIESTVTDRARKRFVHPFDVDGVVVTVQHQAATAAGASKAPRNRHPSGHRFVPDHLGADRLEVGGHVLGDGPFAGRPRHEGRIDGIDLDQAGQRRQAVVAINPHGRMLQPSLRPQIEEPPSSGGSSSCRSSPADQA